MSADTDNSQNDTPQDSQPSQKYTRGPIFDIMSDEEIAAANERILSMIDDDNEEKSDK